MKKEQIYVTIDNEEKRLRAIEILEKAGEEIRDESMLYRGVDNHYKHLCINDKGVWTLFCATHDTEITLDQLEALLMPNYQVKDVILSLYELKQQAEKLGYELVEKPYEPKVGDFGVFWENAKGVKIRGFITAMDGSSGRYKADEYGLWSNFRKLTDQEKQKIQEAW
jgi:hypothetical protein